MTKAEAFPENLGTRRGDLTQEQCAPKLGISRPTRTRLKNGAQNTTIKTLDQIAKSLKVDVGDLFR